MPRGPAALGQGYPELRRPRTTASVRSLRLPDAAAAPPLRRLWRYAGPHRRRVVLATIFTTVNKGADIAPELLIGAAVDVVVKGERSFVSGLLGVEDRLSQLAVLALVNVVVWVIESLFDFLSAVTAEPGADPRAAVRRWSGPGSTPRPPADPGGQRPNVPSRRSVWPPVASHTWATVP